MKITSVTVRRLKTLGSYNNVAVEASATVEDGDNPEGIRAELDLWVQGQISDAKSVDDMRIERNELQWSIGNLRSSKASLEAERESLRRDVERLRKTPLEELASNRDESPF